MTKFSAESSLSTYIACGLGLISLDGGPWGSRLRPASLVSSTDVSAGCLRVAVGLGRKIGGTQSGVCSGVLWLAAAVAPIKGDSGGDWTSVSASSPVSC